MKKWLFRIVAAALVLVIVEVLASLALFIRPTANPLAYASGEAKLHIYRPGNEGFYFGVKPSYQQIFRSDEFYTTIRTNNEGFREDFNFDGNKLDIATVGDSFAFGYGVEVGERYSDRLRQSFDSFSVMSLAYPNGADPASYLLFLQRNPQYIPRVLVVGLFAWNDLREDIASLQLTFDREGNLTGLKSTTTAVNPEGFLVHPDDISRIEPRWRRLMREFHTGRVLLILYHRLSREVLRVLQHDKSDRTEEGADDGASEGQLQMRAFEDGHLDTLARQSLNFLERIDDLVEISGGRVVVFYIPASYRIGKYRYFCEVISQYNNETCTTLRQTNGLGDALASWFRNRNISFIDPTSTFRRLEKEGNRLYFEKDGHWTSVGHTAAADLLANFIHDRGYLD